jgi:hypothetical protein
MTAQYERLARAMVLQALVDIQAGNSFAAEAGESLLSPWVHEALEVLAIENRSQAKLQELILRLPSLPRIVRQQRIAPVRGGWAGKIRGYSR